MIACGHRDFRVGGHEDKDQFVVTHRVDAWLMQLHRGKRPAANSIEVAAVPLCDCAKAVRLVEGVRGVALSPR